jgi:phage N-6-adenine-methyltransferase
VKQATTALMFSKASDEWSTPQEFFDGLHREFHFDVDAAASAENAKCSVWYGDKVDALALENWATVPSSVWLNPPYSRVREFVAKAAEQAERGHSVVCLVPSRTDTRWWHEHIWSADHLPYPNVEIRFVKGRLKFGDSNNSAPFPSVVIIFRPPQPEREAGYGWEV